MVGPVCNEVELAWELVLPKEEAEAIDDQGGMDIDADEESLTPIEGTDADVVLTSRIGRGGRLPKRPEATTGLATCVPVLLSFSRRVGSGTKSLIR